MKLKTNEDGSAVIANGLPVYVHDDGKEAPFDAAASVKRTKELEVALNSEKIGINFDRSKFIAEKLSVPPDLVRAKFGDAFRLEDGKVVAFDKDGKKIWSRARPGEVADFDEALETLVNGYQSRDTIIKKAGGGNAGGVGHSPSGSKTITRSEFTKLTPAAQMAHIKAGGTVG